MGIEDIEFGFFGGFTKFISNVAKTAGRAVGTVTKVAAFPIVKGAQLSGKVPIVGKALSSTLNLTIQPLKATEAIIKGERVDKIALNQLKDQVQAVRDVAPVAKMVVSVVPGVGTGVGAALAAGEALASGKSIDKALVEAAKGAIPGGALASAAIDIGVAAVQGKNVIQASIEAGIKQLPSNIQAAARIVKDAAEGKNITKAVLAEAQKQIPGDLVKKIGNISAVKLVVSSGLDPKQLNALKIVQTVASGKVVPKNILEAAQKSLPKQIMDGMKVGVALGQAKKIQNAVEKQLKHIPINAKKTIANVGLKQIKRNKILQAGIKNLKNKQEKVGFAFGAGLVAHSGLNENTILNLRKQLGKEQQKGFDMALATKVAMVTQKPPNPALPLQAKAAFYATKGMVGGTTQQKTQMMEILASTPLAREGAKEAIVDITKTRKEGLWKRIKKVLGFHGEFDYPDFI